MDKQFYWWHAYGDFGPGEGGFPHLGQVIRHYRKMCGIEKKELAILLGYTQRYVEMLESDQNKEMPQLISRRTVLAQILHIPPVLLGLSSLVLNNPEEKNTIHPELLHIENIAEARKIAFYEGMLVLCWESYYTSSIEHAEKNVAFCSEMLKDEAKETRGIQRDQFDALRCRFYRLSALVSRENLEIEQAYTQIDEAVNIAMHLNNPELIAASLVGRIRIHYNKQRFIEALQDAEHACSYADADLLRDPLKGKCYQMAGEAQAYLAGHDKVLQDKSIAYFDKAGRIARKGNQMEVL